MGTQVYCMKCGGLVPAAARFCPACGTAVADGETATGSTISPPGNADDAKRRHTRRLLGIVGGVIIVGFIAAAALIVWRRQPQPEQTALVPDSAPPEKAPGENSAQLTPREMAGFDWSGLTAEQLHAARAALDEAIAKEEQSAAKSSGAVQTADGKSVP
jgi:hypothetical protein